MNILLILILTSVVSAILTCEPDPSSGDGTTEFAFVPIGDTLFITVHTPYQSNWGSSSASAEFNSNGGKLSPGIGVAPFTTAQDVDDDSFKLEWGSIPSFYGGIIVTFTAVIGDNWDVPEIEYEIEVGSEFKEEGTIKCSGQGDLSSELSSYIGFSDFSGLSDFTDFSGLGSDIGGDLSSALEALSSLASEVETDTNLLTAIGRESSTVMETSRVASTSGTGAASTTVDTTTGDTTTISTSDTGSPRSDTTDTTGTPDTTETISSSTNDITSTTSTSGASLFGWSLELVLVVAIFFSLL